MDDKITLAHGAGGRQTRDLIEALILPRFGNPALEEMGDAALVETGGTRMLFTTDGFVIKPLEFPGGDIGKLAVCGTVNDLSVAGGRPLWLSCSLVIEEGLPTALLERLLDSMAATARAAGVQIVCGDTKVVERGAADGLFICTAGVGLPLPECRRQPVQAGDCVLVSGPVGDHEAAVFRARENVGQGMALVSDCAPVNGLVAAMAPVAGGGLRVMRDPTRGGLATALYELVQGSGCSVMLREEDVPVRAEVRGLCELVGFEPYHLACEGRLVAIAAPERAPVLLAAMRAHPQGREAAIIGELVGDGRGRVYLENSFGGGRVLGLVSGVQLPRIC